MSGRAFVSNLFSKVVVYSIEGRVQPQAKYWFVSLFLHSVSWSTLPVTPPSPSVSLCKPTFAGDCTGSEYREDINLEIQSGKEEIGKAHMKGSWTSFTTCTGAFHNLNFIYTEGGKKLCNFELSLFVGRFVLYYYNQESCIRWR